MRYAEQRKEHFDEGEVVCLRIREQKELKRERAMQKHPRSMMSILTILVVCVAPASGVGAATFVESPGLAQLQVNLNYIWVLAAAALVFLMQAGFMCVESGLARAKNSINVAIKNLADFVLAAATFWAIGFGMMFGTSHAGFFGASDFFISVVGP